MPLTIIGKARDFRTKTDVVYGQVPLSEYLSVIGQDFKDFSIQRKQEKHKAYHRMKEDIQKGAIIPPITLSVKPHLIDQFSPLVSTSDWPTLAKALSDGHSVDILDGLQRTYIINELAQQNFSFLEEQRVLLEFWFEKSLSHLIYRIIVLNAGQKPMSMRHQTELLFHSLKENIRSEIPDLEIYTERDETRRRRARKYNLASVAAAYHAFITKSAEVSRENIVSVRLSEADVLDASETRLVDDFKGFMNYFSRYANLDEEVFRIYGANIREFELGGENEPAKISLVNWFGSENVMTSFFAAVSQFSNRADGALRIETAMDKLGHSLRFLAASDFAGMDVFELSDPLGIQNLERLRKAINPRKQNVGTAIRRILTLGFKEFFRDEGETHLADCWLRSEDEK